MTSASHERIVGPPPEKTFGAPAAERLRSGPHTPASWPWSDRLNTYFCYIHQRGKLTPELRVLSSPTEDDLPDVIFAALPQWPPFEIIEVYDEGDRSILRLSWDGGAGAH
jgi:hypothetical protein